MLNKPTSYKKTILIKSFAITNTEHIPIAFNIFLRLILSACESKVLLFVVKDLFLII